MSTSVFRRHKEGDAADVRGSLLHPQQQDYPQRHEGRKHPYHQTGWIFKLKFRTFWEDLR